jgi:FlaA1/EpsC-like NDP-sugar epimerase
MTAIDLSKTNQIEAKPGLTVLIGTAQTVRTLASQLRAVPGLPQPTGCVLLEDNGEPGLPVLGTADRLEEVHAGEGLGLAIVTLPSSMGDAIVTIRGSLRRLGVAERFVPPIQETLAESGPVLGSPPANGRARVDLAELIGRTAHELDRDAVAGMLTGRRVLITGAGGSIGSEIARICASFEPSRLVLMERAENALFEINRRLAERHPGVSRRAVLHDIVDAEQTLRHLVELKPDVVFHAAAHKHVPLMEDHPSHAVNNNLFGTKSIADAAKAVGTDRFVMISSDKAVNPTSVMGATKRLAEIYIQALHRQAWAGRADGDATRFSMVRFGNVLGSACSVLPIWSAQLADGGPITVTDERMTRFFMTIPEAATLVIQAGAMEPPDPSLAEVYVLDMGEPVRILDLAQRFVRAHGLEPRVRDEASDAGLLGVEIAITGRRPGEKIHEELAYAEEMLRPTSHPGINAWAGDPPGAEDPASLIADLSGVRHSTDRDAVLAAIRRHVREMRPA